MPSGPRETIYGRNAAFEVIRAGRRRVYRLILAEGTAPKGRLQEAVEAAVRIAESVDVICLAQVAKETRQQFRSGLFPAHESRQNARPSRPHA